MAACERAGARIRWFRARCPAGRSAGPTAQPEIVRHTEMSSRSWICFDCRKGIRREAAYSQEPSNDQVVSCPDCGGSCQYLGYKILVPPRRDVTAWEVLRKDLYAAALADQAERIQAAVRKRHEIERQITELQTRPANPERTRLIRRLRRELEGA